MWDQIFFLFFTHISQQIECGANTKIQVSSIKPDTKEIYTKIDATLPLNILFWKKHFLKIKYDMLDVLGLQVS